MSFENEKLLEAFKDLRVADVRDGMDCFGLHQEGSMEPSITPLWRTRAFGIARTVWYTPHEGEIPELEPDKYMEWAGTYYRDVCPYPWIGEIEKGDFIVIDQSGVNAGLMGSANTLDCIKNGAAGFVSNGGVRDTDEIILQKVPFWSSFVSQAMVQNRLQYEDRNIQVNVGGVEVHPGDMIVADGDGVIAVPQKIALDVARLAHEEHERDKKARKTRYEQLGREPDNTL